jgi:hypothetical protein
MNLEQLIQLLNQDEQTEFETPVSESQAGGDSPFGHRCAETAGSKP